MESPSKPQIVKAEPRIMTPLGIVLLMFNCSEEKGPLDTDVKTKALGFIMMAIPKKSNPANMIKEMINFFIIYLLISSVRIILNSFLPNAGKIRWSVFRILNSSQIRFTTLLNLNHSSCFNVLNSVNKKNAF